MELPEIIDVAKPKITMGDRMLGEWTANQSTHDQTEYVRKDRFDAIRDALEASLATIEILKSNGTDSQKLMAQGIIHTAGKVLHDCGKRVPNAFEDDV